MMTNRWISRSYFGIQQMNDRYLTTYVEQEVI